MNRIVIFFMIIAVVVSSLVFYFHVKLFYKMQQNEDKVAFAERILKETQEAKVFIEKNLMEKESVVSGSKLELDTEKTKSVEISKKLSDKVNELLVVKDELRKTRKELERYIKESDEDKANKEKLIAENEGLKKQVEGVEARIEKLKTAGSDSSDMPAISKPREQDSETDSSQEPVSKKQQGKILMINKDYNFILVDLGLVDGLNQSQILSVIREDTSIADVRIEKVYEKMASAVVMSGTVGIDGLLEGDVVIRQELVVSS